MNVGILFSILILTSFSVSVLAEEPTMQDVMAGLQENHQKMQQVKEQLQSHEQMTYERIFLATDSTVKVEEGLGHAFEGGKIIVKDSAKEYQLNKDDEFAKSKLGAGQKIKDILLKTDKQRLVFEIRSYRRAELFGFIGMDMPVTLVVDAETGDYEERLPWYSFLFKK